MWFKNIWTFRLTQPDVLKINELEENLKSLAFTPCASTEQSHYGWVSALPGAETLFHGVNNNQLLLLRACKESREVPGDVLKRALDEKVAELKQTMDRDFIGKREKDQIREDLIFEFLPRAFSKFSYTTMYIDIEKKLVVVEANARGDAESILALLRKSLGTLPVQSYFDEFLISQQLYDWVIHPEQVPDNFIVGEHTKLVGRDSKKITIENEDLYANKIQQLIVDEDREVDFLSFDYGKDFSFVLTAKGQVKNIRYNELITEQNDDVDSDDVLARIDADFVLMAGILSEFLVYCEKAKIINVTEEKAA